MVGRLWGGRNMWEFSVLSAHLCYEPKHTLKLSGFGFCFFRKKIVLRPHEAFLSLEHQPSYLSTISQRKYINKMTFVRATVSSIVFYQICYNFNPSH